MQTESRLSDQSPQGSQPRRLDKPVRISEQTWPLGTIPVLSVFSWAYNHARFIRESIESILMQETTFPVEIIVHDDASCDGTQEIINEYTNKYPNLFRNIIHKTNQLSLGKCLMEPVAACSRGEFIALTHGDDFWTSAEKLQTQMLYLIDNPSISCCCHQTTLIDENNNILRGLYRKQYGKQFSIIDCIQTLKKGYATCSMVFRKAALGNPRPWFRADGNDMFLELQLAQCGNIAFLDKNMGAYRRHGAGVWSSLSDVEQTLALIKRYDLLLTDKDHSAEVRNALQDARKSQIEKLCLKRHCKDVLSESSSVISAFLSLYGAATWVVETIRRAIRKT